MRIVSTIDAAEVVHDGETFRADDDGIFEVPEPVGQYLTGFPVWLTEWQARAIEDAAQADRDTDAVLQARRIKALEDRVDELTGIVGELVGKLAAPAKRAPKAKAPEAEPEAPAAETTE